MPEHPNKVSKIAYGVDIACSWVPSRMNPISVVEGTWDLKFNRQQLLLVNVEDMTIKF